MNYEKEIPGKVYLKENNRHTKGSPKDSVSFHNNGPYSQKD